jgi:hypothetical protein
MTKSEYLELFKLPGTFIINFTGEEGFNYNLDCHHLLLCMALRQLMETDERVRTAVMGAALDFMQGHEVDPDTLMKTYFPDGYTPMDFKTT